MQQKRTKKTKSSPMPILAFIGLGILIFGCLAFLPNSAAADAKTDAEACAQCHEDQVAAFKAAIHAGSNCSDCHGDAAKHMEEGEGAIFAFKEADTPNAKSARCLKCHQGNHSRFFASSHGKASMACTDCHKAHAPAPMQSKMTASKSCHACHEDVFAQFKLNERHRLQEGILGCGDCHNPHEPAARERLGGFKHEACLKCHTDKGGPFIFEHGASRIEGCSACHEVHGSPNRHMLLFQNSSDLCFSCHTTSPNWHQYFSFNHDTTNCVTCHSTIHGSNFDHLFLK